MKAKILVSLSILLIPIFSSAQEEELRNKIIWDENRPLSWNDFRGAVNNKLEFKAWTCSGVFYKIQQISKNEIKVSVETFFDPYKSWQNKKIVSEKLLEHEQHHFDITKIQSRLFMKDLLEIDFSTKNNTIEKIRQAYLQNLKNISSFNDMYDKETEHSTNEEQQNLWNAGINRKLFETEDYDLKELTLRFRISPDNE